MSTPQFVAIHLDHRLLEHPRAYHLRRMRVGLWLYLDLLARLPAGADTLEVEPAAIGSAMGLAEATIRSWLGHLRRGGYIDVNRLNGAVRVTIRRAPASLAAPAIPQEKSIRFFTVAKLQRALGEEGNGEALQAALNLNADEAIRSALAGALALPQEQIRRSRTAFFIYLLKRHAHQE